MRKWSAAALVVALLALSGCGGSGAGTDTTPDASDTTSGPSDGTTEEMRPLEPPGCTPDCQGRECGSNGCGGSCGHCFTVEGALDDTLCMENGTCCAPNCTGRECGSNGCSGTCGDCAVGTQCIEGQCKPGGCVPDCDGKACGDNGCQGSCGACTGGKECYQNQCVTCAPQCAGKECGYDGCSGTCGNCGSGEVCKDNQCVPCKPDCTGKECGGDGCGGICGKCAAGEQCKEGQCKPTGCVPDCGGKACGDDGCGGPCGECGAKYLCVDFQCVLCTPDCEGMACGDDGCGGNCGTCPDTATCQDGLCACDDGFEWNPNGDACWPVCPDNASYVPEAGECLCDPGTVLGLDGVTCLLECPPFSHSEEGLCTCAPGTTLGDDGTTCVPPPKVCNLNSAAYPVPGDFAGDRFARTVNTENKYPITLDKFTGLTWQGCDAGTYGYTCTEGTFSLKKPASAASYCDTSTWAGYDDWYLPSMVDWLVVVDQGLSYPYGASEFFWYYDKIDTNVAWWSSNKPLYADVPQEVYLALMKDDPALFGFEFYVLYGISSFGRRVRCVRDPTPPPSHCAWVIGTPTAERVLYLEAANLFWQGCPAGQSGKDCQTGTAKKMSWDEAVAYCDSLVWGGLDDWSLPHLNLFATIVDYTVAKEPLLDPALLPNTLGTSFWTSKAAPEGKYWAFDYQAGQPVATGPSLPWSVRCVRFCPGNFAGPSCETCAPGWQGEGCDVPL